LDESLFFGNLFLSLFVEREDKKHWLKKKKRKRMEFFLTRALISHGKIKR
jgi:hypothetical protein